MNKLYKTLDKFKKTNLYETIKHSKNYFSAEIGIKAIGLISIPIFTRILSTEEYGILNIFNSYIGIFSVILTLNLHSAIGRYFYENKPDFKEFVGTTVCLVSLSYIISSIVSIALTDKISVYFNLNTHLIALILVSVLLSIIYSIYYQILVTQKKSREVSLISIIQNCIGFLGSVALVFYLPKAKYLGIILGYLFASFLVSIYSSLKLRSYIRLLPKLKHVVYIFKYSIPLIPYSLSGIILAQCDRIMIGSIKGLSDAGLYSFAYNIGMLLLMVIGATQTAIMPDFYKLIEKKEYRVLDNLVKKLFLIILVFSTGLIFYSKELVYILSDAKYHATYKIIPIIVIGYVFFSMFYIYIRYIDYTKKTIWSSVILLSSGLINIVLNASYIPKFGYVTGAYTTMISYGIMFILAWFVSKFILRQEITNVLLIIKPLIAFLLFVLMYYVLDLVVLNSIVIFVIKFILLGAFCLIAFNNEIKKLINADIREID